MAIKTKSQTPGCHFHTHVNGQGVSVKVQFPRELVLDEEEAAELDSNLHNAVELVLARYFVETS